MFWRFNYLTSDIDNLLDKEDVTLHEILNEDDVLQECKAQNKKLVDFLVRPDNLERLVSFVVQTPSEDVNEKLKYKYPNIACELLTSDVNQITDALVLSTPLLDTIMNFLESNDTLNPLQASFFGKVVGLLITRKGELVVDFLKSHEHFIERVFHHLGTSAIMDLLLRLVTSIEPAECRVACITWLLEQQLIKKLVAMIDPSNNSERNVNAAQALCDLICITREQLTQQLDSSPPDPLLTEIESPETVSLLLSHMFDSGDILESVIISGLQVIQTLLEYRRVGPEGNLEQMIQADMDRFSQGISNTVQALIPHLKDFHNLLLEPPKQHYIPMSWTLGVLDKPLGNTRLQTVHLIATLLSTNTSAVNDQLAKLGTVNVLLDLYFEYSWNNFLHRQVEQCLSCIVANDSADHTLLSQLITEFRLLQRVVKGFTDNQVQQSSPGGRRLGYMGHLTRIANHLINNTVNSKNAQKIEDLILNLPSEIQTSWEQFKSGPLAEINKKNSCELVPGNNISSCSDDEFGRINFPQDGQKFGFNEDDLNGADDDTSLPFGEQRLSLSPSGNTDDSTAMFEDACNRRMPFDHSDDDLWVEKEITFSPTASTTRSTAESTVVGSMVVSDPDSDDDDERRDSDDDSDEDLSSSLQKIHQQPDTAVGVRAADEDMDISSSDDWAKFDDVMDVASAASTQTLPWQAGAATIDTSSSSANDSWANFNAEATASTSMGQGDDDNWADFTGFNWSGSQSSGFEPTSGSTISGSNVESDRTAAYIVSSSSDVRAADSYSIVNDFVDTCSSSGSDDLRTGDGLAVHGVKLPMAENGPS